MSAHDEPRPRGDAGRGRDAADRAADAPATDASAAASPAPLASPPTPAAPDASSTSRGPRALGGQPAAAPAVRAGDSSCGDEDAAESGPPKYQPAPARRRPFSVRGAVVGAVHVLATFWYLLRHTLGTFDAGPAAPQVEISASAPGGDIDEGQLAVCQRIADGAAARLDKLEQKSTTLLSVIVVAAPLVAASALFVRQQAPPGGASTTALVLQLAGGAAVLLAFVAVLRALAVRGHQDLHLHTVIDPETDAVRPYRADFYGRALLWTAANRQAVADHVADFVRAAQVLLALGVALTVLGTAPVLTTVHGDTQQIEGVIRLDPRSTEELGTAAARGHADPQAARAAAERVSALERRVDSLRAVVAGGELAREVAKLRAEIDALRRTPVAPPGPAPGAGRGTAAKHVPGSQTP